MPTFASFDGTTLGAWETLSPLDKKLTHHTTVTVGSFAIASLLSTS